MVFPSSALGSSIKTMVMESTILFVINCQRYLSKCVHSDEETISAVNIFLQTPPYLHLSPVYRRSQDWYLVLVSVFFDDCSELCCFCFTTEKRHLPSIEKCDLIQFRSIILGSLDYRELQPIIRPLSTAQLCLFWLVTFVPVPVGAWGLQNVEQNVLLYYVFVTCLHQM